MGRGGPTGEHRLPVGVRDVIKEGMSAAIARVLIADDQRAIVDALRILLGAEGFEVTGVTSVAGIEAAVAEQDFDVLLMDLNYSRDTTSGREGLDLLGRLGRNAPRLPVVVMTAWGSIDSVVEAMRAGARDYVEKPWKNERLVATLRSQAELGRALQRARILEAENARLRGPEHSEELVADSAAMQPVHDMIDRIGPSDANVLVTGEHGTGKEVVARRLHAVSKRAGRPLVIVNGGGLADSMFESELFGHVKGAFTDAKSDRVGCFELANGGTLFLDEIGNMPPTQQAKLLRVLQTGELRPLGTSQVRRVDVRIITATNADLNQAVAAGAFREDLLYRLNTVEIHVPPLRERAEDIAALGQLFLGRFARHYSKEVIGLSSAALAAMLKHPWPGNVRELEHAVERAVLMARTAQIRPEDLTLKSRDQAAATGLEDMSLDDVEQLLIKRALDRCGGNVKQAAGLLGLSRSALYRRLERHGMGNA